MAGADCLLFTDKAAIRLMGLIWLIGPVMKCNPADDGCPYHPIFTAKAAFWPVEGAECGFRVIVAEWDNEALCGLEMAFSCYVAIALWVRNRHMWLQVARFPSNLAAHILSSRGVRL